MRKTSFKSIAAKVNYLDNLSKRRINFGASEDGATTESHKTVVKISEILRKIANRLIKREHNFAFNSFNSDLFNSARPSQRSKVNCKAMKAGRLAFIRAARKTVEKQSSGQTGNTNNAAKVAEARRAKARKAQVEQQRERQQRTQQARPNQQHLSPQEVRRRQMLRQERQRQQQNN